MKYGQLILTKRDYDLLKLILLNWNMSTELSEANYNLLINELENVKIVEEKDLPQDIVKFQSTINIETPFGLLENYELVVPSQRDPLKKKLSILSPIGSAIIGYAEGDEVKWNFPVGERTIKIIKVKNKILA